MTGNITIDMKGPIAYKLLPHIVCRFVSFILSDIQNQLPLSNYALSFFYNYLNKELRKHSPYTSMDKLCLMERLTLRSTLDCHKSASCCYPIPINKAVSVRKIWELPDLTDYPIIFSYEGNFMFNSTPISNRDRLRSEGSVPLKIPKNPEEWITIEEPAN